MDDTNDTTDTTDQQAADESTDSTETKGKTKAAETGKEPRTFSAPDPMRP